MNEIRNQVVGNERDCASFERVCVNFLLIACKHPLIERVFANLVDNDSQYRYTVGHGKHES